MLFNAFGISMVLMVASAASFTRLYTISLPALILLVWFLDAPFKLERTLLRGLWMVALLLAAANPLITQTRWHAALNLPTGPTAFFSRPSYDKTAWLLQRTKPSQYFFGDPFDSFALRLRNPGPISFVRPTGYTRPEEVQALVNGLENHQVEFVSWYASLDNDLAGSPEDNLAPLREELRKHYRVAVAFANDDRVWERVR